MRLSIVALSTVLLSGCSWMGSGGGYGYGDSYSYGQGGAYGCAPMAGGAAYGNQAYGFQGGQGGAGCAGGAGYNVAYGGAGGAGMYGVGGAGAYGAGGGLRGAHGVNGYGTGLQSAGTAMYGAGGAGMYGAGAGAGGAGMYGAGTGMYGAGTGMYGAGTGGYGAATGLYGAGTGLGTGIGAGLGGVGTGITTLGSGAGVYGTGSGITTLGSVAPYGAALGGIQTLPGGGTVQTVQGAPIYVPQPYPAYYSAGGGGGGYYYSGGGYGGALPFGLELGAGQDFILDGDIFPGDVAKTDPISGLTVSDIDAIGYDDAWGNAKGADLTATYDVSPNTTLLGRVGYSKADGNLLNVGTVSDGIVTEDFYVEYSDLEQYTVEGGFRHYMGQPTGMRPYVGATAGFTKTEDVTLTQSSATLVDPAVFTQTYVDGGWSPTASGVVGAEWAVGGRSAIGVETGIRWTEALDSNFVSDDRISVPVRLRGRLSF